MNKMNKTAFDQFVKDVVNSDPKYETNRASALTHGEEASSWVQGASTTHYKAKSGLSTIDKLALAKISQVSPGNQLTNDKNASSIDPKHTGSRVHINLSSNFNIV